MCYSHNLWSYTLVMEDKKYFTLNSNKISGNNSFYKDTKQATADDLLNLKRRQKIRSRRQLDVLFTLGKST